MECRTVAAMSLVDDRRHPLVFLYAFGLCFPCNQNHPQLLIVMQLSSVVYRSPCSSEGFVIGSIFSIRFVFSRKMIVDKYFHEIIFAIAPMIDKNLTRF